MKRFKHRRHYLKKYNRQWRAYQYWKANRRAVALIDQQIRSRVGWWR